MTIIKRYAEGFLEYAKETIGFKNGLEELQGLRDVLRENPEFRGFLENPAINNVEKYKVIDSALEKNFSEETRSFVKLLLKKGRIGIFKEIAEYVRIKYAHGEKTNALLYTTYPMDTDMLQDFKAKLEKKLQLDLQLYVNLTPELLGGPCVMFRNKVLDGSVRKRLEDMKRKLLAAKVALNGI